MWSWILGLPIRLYHQILLEVIGVTYENGDVIYEAYGIGGSVPFYTKSMDQIQLDSFIINDFKVDVGMLPEGHRALLGLDILKQNNFIIDLNNLELHPFEQKKED